MICIRGCEPTSELVYDFAKGRKGNFMDRIEIESLSLRSIRHLANSTVDTKWPMPGAGMNTSSSFSISSSLREVSSSSSSFCSYPNKKRLVLMII